MSEEEEGELSQALKNYMNPDHPEYDPAFEEQIRIRQPGWFEEEDELTEEEWAFIKCMRRLHPEYVKHVDEFALKEYKLFISNEERRVRDEAPGRAMGY